MRLAPVLLIVVACTSANRPADQDAFLERAHRLRTEWKATDGNDIRRGEVEDQARKFFRQERRTIGWTASVKRVASGLGSTWIEAEEDGVRFMLRPPDGQSDYARAGFSRLSPGDRVKFNGTTAGEISVTIAGAILEPEVSVTLDKVESL